ncbi:c-type cytochrome, methanol metabolism-related [Paracoccus chinensis]|uniref:C-type cytochrome, methanol metabolism-related n=1 Tax=Paracoccus chinensis TaxID=525640 RepID=A0A1G9K6Q5_9RHOB|nr:c-type cytochrome, methanol metabolism-related [Paracoccus chinensis]
MIATTVRATAASLAFATAALAQTAAPTAAPAAAEATQAQPNRGSSTPIPEGATTVEMKANAAGSAVATGAGEVAAGQFVGVVKPTLEGLDLTPDHMENGRWYNAEGIPVPNVQNGQVDYATFSGYRRYHAECHVCHGPDGEGSTYAPALKDSVVHGMDYYTYQEIVASGKQDVNRAANLVMPAFGTNRNVWCYVDDIYVYLLARGTEAIPRGRPADKADKSEEFAAQEASCMEG